MNVQPGRVGFESYAEHLDLEADVCIVGAGAGGAAAACAIAERGLSVVVVEEGRHWQPADFQPSGPWAFKHLYAGRGTRATRGNAVIPVPGGRGVGGSTLINSAICFRTPPSVLAEWRDRYGCAQLDQAWMDQCFDRIWNTIGVTVNPPEFQRNNNDIFRRGAEAMGLDGRWMARSAPGCTGCGTCQQGCPTGGKLSVDRSFLQLALNTGQVGVYGDCRVDEVSTEAGRVTELRGRTIRPLKYADAGTFRVRARHFVLSAGAIGTPRLLQRHGLGAGPVGDNFHIHPTSGVLAKFDEEILPWEGVTQGYYVDLWKEGYILQTFSASPDQYYISLPLGGDDVLGVLKDLRYIASAGAVVHDEDSVGHVGEGTLVYWLGDEDRRRIVRGMRMCARVYFAAGAKEVYSSIHGAPPIRSEAEIDDALPLDTPAHQIGLYASHPMGTCRMGSDPQASVVDPEGRVWGWDNLWVSDASVFPTSLGVNPQVTIMALGLTIGRQVARAGGAH